MAEQMGDVLDDTQTAGESEQVNDETLAAPDEAAESAPVNGDDDKTLIEGAHADEPVAAPADWPEDWRAKVAGDDEKLLKRLERFKSVNDVVKSWREAEQKLSSGQLKAKLADDASDDEVAAYRKENGIPDAPEGYLEALDSGLVIGDDDKELVGSFLEAAHAKNADPAVVNMALDWYYSAQEGIAAQQSEADKALRAEAVEELRSEWGPEYRANINAAMNFMETAPTMPDGSSLKEALMGARLADGSLFGDNPAALRWLVDLANAQNPAGFIAPSAAGSQVEGVQDEIKRLETYMREKPKEYYKDEKAQARLRKLYEAEEKLAS